MTFGRSQTGSRTEDARFLTGKGRFLMNRHNATPLTMIVVRSPYGHAEIEGIDTAAATAVKGVAGVLTADDLERENIGGLPCKYVIESIGGRQSHAPPFGVLARGRVRYAGQAVAAVVAESRETALEAAELVDVSYGSLDAVIGLQHAVSADAAPIWDQAPDNVAMHWRSGDADAVAAAFGAAAHVVTLELVNNRVSANTMEPRGAVGAYDAADGSFTLHTCCQGPQGLRQVFAEDVLGVAQSKLRVVTGDVGGGFGMKLFAYAEQALVLIAARRFGRAVAWFSERSEALLSDYHGRDHETEICLALDADGRFLALKVDTLANLGAQLSLYGMAVPSAFYVEGLAGAYDLPAIQTEVRGVFTNTGPVDAYRGAGRAEGTYALERVVDAAADALGIDPVELRLRNTLSADRLPYSNAVGRTYDSGAFAQCIERAAERAGWSGFATRRAAAARRGALRGIGVGSYLLPVGYGAGEFARIEIDGTGGVTVMLGNVSCGQGHETSAVRLIEAALGIDPARIRIVQGDTGRVSQLATANSGSHFLQTAGPALQGAAARIVDKGKRIAAHLMEVRVEDIEFSGGGFVVAGTDQRLGLTEIAAAAYNPGALPGDIEPGWDEAHYYRAESDTFPFGCHIVEVEIDPETGATEIIAYTAVNDFGRILNPDLVAGQIHGGVAQGVGQALIEHCVYDPDGQLLSGSFMDYAMPRADLVPTLDLAFVETPTGTNPLGVKGCGEAGATVAPAAVMNAVLDALRPLGVRKIDMPATPERVWRAIRSAGAEASA
ncbi:MAG: xanthine dehydrogenase family protein molybdopterin-binding subunit [Thermohalobaculum sp.]